MTYVKLFVDYLDAMEPLGDAEKGRLFTALLEYARSGEAPQLPGNERFLFPILRAQIDRDASAYEEFCEKQSANGRKGGRPKKNPKNPGLSEKTQKSQDKDKDKDKDKDYDKDQDKDQDKEKETPPIPPTGGQEGGGFDRFWQEYPRKVGRENARRSWEKLSPDQLLTETILSAVKRDRDTDQWQREDGRYIPYPATWLNQRRWEDEPDTGTEPPYPPPEPFHYPTPEEDHSRRFDSDMDWRDLI